MNSFWKRINRSGKTAVTGFALLSCFFVSAQGETLEEALALAYMTHPDLEAARARVREVDETYVQARAQGRPQLNLSASGGVSGTSSHRTRDIYDETTPKALTAIASQTLFTGGRVKAAMSGAEASIYAQREALRNTEQTILLQTVQAYMNVIRDENVITIRRNNVKVLQGQLEAAQDRFSVGEGTRTDVAQAQSSLARAQSDFVAAQAQLANSRANYEKTVGRPAGTLVQPSSEPALPESLAQSLKLGRQRNPLLLSARFSETAARYKIKEERAALNPSFRLEASFSASHDTNIEHTDTETAALIGRLSIPLFEGGALRSRIRSAKAAETRHRMTRRSTEREVLENITKSWNNLEASRAVIASTQEQVNASEIAFEGVQLEYQVGSRTTQNVLDAEQILLNARLSLVTAERNNFVAAFSLLQAIGGLTADNLNLPLQIYIPEDNFKRIQNRYFSTKGG